MPNPHSLLLKLVFPFLVSWRAAVLARSPCRNWDDRRITKDNNLDGLYGHDTFLGKMYSTDFGYFLLFFNLKVKTFKVTLKAVGKATWPAENYLISES